MFGVSVNFSHINIKCFIFSLTFLSNLSQLFQPSKIIIFFSQLILFIELTQNHKLYSPKSDFFLHLM